ncbi:MAG: glycosyltransferase family 1 protein [Candidatus Spechtbacterales bacterium]
MNKIKKIIHIGVDAHNLEGNRTGVGRYLENVLREISKEPDVHKKVRFTLYFKGEIPKDNFLQDPLFQLISLKTPAKTSFMLYFLFLLPFNGWRDRLDVLWFPSYMVPHTWRGKSVVVLHDIIFERYPEVIPTRYRIPYRLFGKNGAKRSEKIITVSEYSKKEISELYKVKSEKIVVTSLGVDKMFRVVSDEDKISNVKEKYAIKKDFLLYIGQIFNRRHVDSAMKAYGRIAHEFPDLQFIVVGRNRTNPFIDIDQLAKDINDLTGREGIVRHEFVPDEDLPTLYSAAKAGFYLSDYEGFGLPPLEFLACGTPPLAPNTTSLETTLQREQVVIENTEDVNEIADALRDVLTDEELLAKTKHRGPEYASQFTWEKTADETLEVFLNL